MDFNLFDLIVKLMRLLVVLLIFQSLIFTGSVKAEDFDRHFEKVLSTNLLSIQSQVQKSSDPSLDLSFKDIDFLDSLAQRLLKVFAVSFSAQALSEVYPKKIFLLLMAPRSPPVKI